MAIVSIVVNNFPSSFGRKSAFRARLQREVARAVAEWAGKRVLPRRWYLYVVSPAVPMLDLADSKDSSRALEGEAVWREMIAVTVNHLHFQPDTDPGMAHAERNRLAALIWTAIETLIGTKAADTGLRTGRRIRRRLSRGESRERPDGCSLFFWPKWRTGIRIV